MERHWPLHTIYLIPPTISTLPVVLPLSGIRQHLRNSNPDIRFTAAATALFRIGRKAPFEHRGPGQVVPSGAFSAKDVLRCLDELAAGFASRDPARLGQRTYIAEHLSNIYDKRLIPILVAIVDEDLAVTGTGHLSALWSLLDLTDLDPVPEPGFWHQWYTNNYEALRWNGKHFLAESTEAGSDNRQEPATGEVESGRAPLPPDPGADATRAAQVCFNPTARAWPSPASAP